MNLDNIEPIGTSEITNCPVCGSSNIRLDFDYPETMKCCEQCGADFMYDGEIILDPRKTI